MHGIETIDHLLIDELAATETYSQVLNKLGENVALGDSEGLRAIFDDHRTAVSSLQTQIRDLGGTPAKNSGVWGAWAKLVQGGANAFGKQTALTVLQEGEKSGLEDYGKALLDQKLDPEARELIERTLVPAQRAHIQTLERMNGATVA